MASREDLRCGDTNLHKRAATEMRKMDRLNKVSTWTPGKTSEPTEEEIQKVQKQKNALERPPPSTLEYYTVPTKNFIKSTMLIVIGLSSYAGALILSCYRWLEFMDWIVERIFPKNFYFQDSSHLFSSGSPNKGPDFTFLEQLKGYGVLFLFVFGGIAVPIPDKIWNLLFVQILNMKTKDDYYYNAKRKKFYPLSFWRMMSVFKLKLLLSYIFIQASVFLGVSYFAFDVLDVAVRKEFYKEFENSKKLDGLSIFITGANSGLGLESAKFLAGYGRAKTIYLGCRSAKKCDAAKSEVEMHCEDWLNAENDRLLGNNAITPKCAAVKTETYDLFGDSKQLGSLSFVKNKEKIDILMANAGFFNAVNANQRFIDEKNARSNDTTNFDKSYKYQQQFMMHAAHVKLKEFLIRNNNEKLKTITNASVGSYAGVFMGLQYNVHKFFVDLLERMCKGVFGEDFKENSPLKRLPLDVIFEIENQHAYMKTKFWQVYGKTDAVAKDGSRSVNEVSVQVAFCRTNIDTHLTNWNHC